MVWSSRRELKNMERRPQITQDDVITQVAEWVAFSWHKSQMASTLSIQLGIKIDNLIMSKLISRAKKYIASRHNLPLEELRGNAFEFYSTVIRDNKTSIQYKLKARERLDSLYGIEVPTGEGADEIARKIRDAMKDIDSSVPNPNSVTDSVKPKRKKEEEVPDDYDSYEAAQEEKAAAEREEQEAVEARETEIAKWEPVEEFDFDTMIAEAEKSDEEGTGLKGIDIVN